MKCSEAAGSLNYMRRVRRTLHKFPETAFGEFGTQRFITEELDKLGIPYRTVSTGVVAELAGEQKEIVAFRADMDALAMTERKDCEYRSENEGVMHACGHDGHMANLLTLAKVLSEHKPKRTVRLIFQPAEEGEGGALAMIAGGVLENVQEIYAMHVDPQLPVGSVGVMPGADMAGTVEFDVRISGRSAHAAQRENGSDALKAAADCVEQFEALSGGFPSERLLLHAGKLVAGTARNIVANQAKIEATFRYFDSAVKVNVMRNISEQLGQIDARYRTQSEIHVIAEYIPVVNDLACAERVMSAARDAGCELPSEKPRFTAEDFSFYCDKIPGALFWLGVDSGEHVKLHTPEFDFKEESLLYGLDIMLALI